MAVNAKRYRVIMECGHEIFTYAKSPEEARAMVTQMKGIKTTAAQLAPVLAETMPVVCRCGRHYLADPRK